MKVGDLVRVTHAWLWIGQLGVIAEVGYWNNCPFGNRVMLISGEEYWFEAKELEVIDESR
jgi:hypothetical protein